MELKQLQYFVASVSAGSFKKAAESLYTTQPHISKVLKSLEEELGMSLLKRDSKGVTLTEEGKKVYEYANEILMNSNRISHLRQQTKETVVGIGAASIQDMMHLFSAFYRQEEWEGVQYQYFEGNSEELMQLLHKHKIEVGFLYISDMQRSAFEAICEKKRLLYTEITKAEPVVFVGPKSDLYHMDSIDVSNLKNQKFICEREDMFTLGNYLGQFNEAVLKHEDLKQAVITDSSHTMLNMLAETKLCSIGVRFAKKRFESIRIRAIPILNMKGQISFGYIKRSRTPLDKEAEEFVRYIEKNKA